RVTDLVDLVNRQGVPADRDRGGAREDDGAALGQLVGQRLGHDRAAPRRERVGGAAWTGEDEARRAEPRERRRGGLNRALARIDGERPGKAGDLDRELDSLGEVVDGARRDLRRVFL